MSVNKFGSSSNSNSSKGNNNKYTDSKFITLTKNLNTKLDKSGDTMSGSLNMGNCKITNLCDPQESNDAANKKYVDASDTLVRFYVDQYELVAKTYTDQRELVAKTYTDLKETEAKSYVDSREAILRTYIDAQKERTELLVANNYVKNNVGFIPDLLDNQNNKCGFIASAIGGSSFALNVFNSWKGDWIVQSFPVQLERWIKVGCPEPVKIHKFTIRGRDGENVGKITNWKFQGSMDDNSWDDLYTGNNELIDYEFKTFQISPEAERYIYYRFIILGITGNNVGLNHLQIYSCDPIM
jgi:hypothetical protein